VAAIRTMFLDTFGQREVDTVFEHLRAATGQMSVMQIRALGGAMARVPAEATAFAHRTRRFMVNVAALYQNADDAPAQEAWVSDFAAALRQDSMGAYVNFLGDEGAACVR